MNLKGGPVSMLNKPLLRERLLRGGGWAVSGRIIGIAAALSLNVILARLLTPEEMGAYFLTMSVVSVAVLLGQAGLPTAVVRLLAESLGKGQTGRAKDAIKLAVALCSLFSLVVAGVFYLGLGHWMAGSLFSARPMEKVVGVSSLIVVLAALQGLIAEIFRGFHDIRLATLLGGVSTSLFSAIAFAVIWALHGHSDLKQVMLLSLGAWCITFLIAGFILRFKLSSLHGKGNIDSRSVLTLSVPMGITSLAVFAATKGDLWVVGAFLPEQQVAIYGAVLRLVMIMTMTYVLVIATIQSTIAEMYGQGDMSLMQRLVQGSAFVACVPAFGLLVIYAVFGNELMEMLFGSFYQNGYWPLLIVSAGQCVNMLFGPVEMVLMMTGYQNHLMKLILATVCISFFLAILLVKIYGLIGVAVAWAIGSILQGLGSRALVKKNLGIKCHVRMVSMNEWFR